MYPFRGEVINNCCININLVSGESFISSENHERQHDFWSKIYIIRIRLNLTYFGTNPDGERANKVQNKAKKV